MKTNTVFLLCIFLATVKGFSQTLHFTDPELKRYLINEQCVDTTDNGVFFSYDLPVDLNGDNEIQLEEAEQVKMLGLRDYIDEYSIKSIQDLNSFPQLRYLHLLSIDSIVEIRHLQLDSLRSLWIGNSASLRVIDISNLPGLTETLRIEGLLILDTLNIRNGSVASLFSLFYTLDTKYACIDSIAAEYRAFGTFGAMLPGIEPSIDCMTVGIEENEISHLIEVFPNPASTYLEIDSPYDIDKIEVLNLLGEGLIEKMSSKVIDLSMISSGVYFLKIQSGEKWGHRKFVIQR